MGKNILISEQQFGGLLTDLITWAIKGFPDEKKDDNNSNNSTTTTDFDTQVNKVIDNFEGGYYNPETMNMSPMGDSGETMMGIDRKHGVGFGKTAEGQEFWKLIDDADAKNKWKYNYMGGPLEPKLRSLVSKMIKSEFDKLSSRYLSPEAQKIVKNSPELTFHFIYATWNGPGWFQKFAKKINDSVANGITDPKELAKIAMDSRKNSGNSLIAKSGNKMSQFLGIA